MQLFCASKLRNPLLVGTLFLALECPIYYFFYIIVCVVLLLWLLEIPFKAFKVTGYRSLAIFTIYFTCYNLYFFQAKIEFMNSILHND